MQASIEAADYAATEAFVTALRSLADRIDGRAERRGLR
jgi:hypothetical protein